MASPGSEILIYRSSAACLVELARLNGVAPPRGAEGALQAPEVDDGDGDGDGSGLFVALLQGGSIVDVARLLFRGGELSDADGGSDCYSSNASTSNDRAASSGSTGEQKVCSKDLDEDLTALCPSIGGLMMEREEWANPRNLVGEGKEQLGCGGDGDSDWAETRGSRSAEEEIEDSSRKLEEAVRNNKPLQMASSFWSSGSCTSSSDDEDQDEKLEHDKENDEENYADQALLITDDPKSADEENYVAIREQKLDQEKNYADSRNDKQDQDKEQSQEYENGSEKDAYQSVQINLKLWPGQRHALIKIFSGGKWVLTKDFILSWMKLEDVSEYNLKVEFGSSFATVSGFRNTNCTMNFEVNTDCTPELNNLMTLLKPSICNFRILKNVGGEDACKVFKCLFMGRKCALKSLTQENPCTVEPREISIISNLKDMNVMIFYQAWTEPWIYKGQAEQEYLFIHFEFCPSTLKHALLKKNINWFPNKWFLFEQIVRTIQRLHEALVVHRDLKPDNIFLSSELVVRVGDFGDSCIGHDELGLYGGGTPNLGTQFYLAPELDSGGKVTQKVDIYSLGVILFEIFAIYETGSERILELRNLREQGPNDCWDGDRKLYHMMTALEPSARPSAGQVLDYIHKYHSE